MREEKKTKSQLIEELLDLRKKISRFESVKVNLEKIKNSMKIVFDALNSSANGVVITDIQGRIVYVNPSFLKMLAYDKKDELTGMDAAALFATPKAGNFFDVKRIINEKDDFSEEFIAERKDGNRIPVRGSCSNITSKDRKIIGRMASFIDLSEEYTVKKRLKAATSRVHFLTSKLVESEERQKKLIAKDLHDGVGSNLTAIKFALEEKLYASLKCNSSDTGSLEQIISMVRETIDEVHRVSSSLRPAVLDEVGLIPAISAICRDFQDVQSAVRVEAIIEAEEDEIPEHLKITIYRVLQEAMSNAFKHSRAKNVQISLKRMDVDLILAVKDDGRGFDAEHFMDAENNMDGMGLSSMKERVHLNRGRFDILSEKGKGTVVEAVWSLAGISGR